MDIDEPRLAFWVENKLVLKVLAFFFVQAVLEEHHDRSLCAVDFFVFAHANHCVRVHAFA